MWWVEAFHDKSPPCQVVDYKHCGSGDTMFLVVQGKDSTLNLSLQFTFRAHGMLCANTQNFRRFSGQGFSILVTHICSHNWWKLYKNILQSVQIQRLEGKGAEEKEEEKEKEESVATWAFVDWNKNLYKAVLMLSVFLFVTLAWYEKCF